MYNTTKSLNQPLFTQPNATVSKHLLWISIVTHVKAAYTTHATQWNIMKDWKIISELSQPSFCFAHGDLPVKCMDDFHWCYEGECGPEFWDTHFEVQSIDCHTKTKFHDKKFLSKAPVRVNLQLTWSGPRTVQRTLFLGNCLSKATTG